MNVKEWIDENLSLSKKILWGICLPSYCMGVVVGNIENIVVAFVILVIGFTFLTLLLHRILVRNPTTLSINLEGFSEEKKDKIFELITGIVKNKEDKSSSICDNSCICFRINNEDHYCSALGKVVTEGSECEIGTIFRGKFLIDRLDELKGEEE
jgi:hypothetical protein